MPFLLICYDSPSDARRVQFAHLLEGHGRRVQKSVFECQLDKLRAQRLQAALLDLKLAGEDRLLIVELSLRYQAMILASGRSPPPMPAQLWLL